MIGKNIIFGKYPPISRGTNTRIPVEIFGSDKKAVNISDYKVVFTLKDKEYDEDRFDKRAFISKDFNPQNAEKGRFFIELTSEDTYLPPDKYFFDIQLVHNSGEVVRVAMLETSIIGGPTNRTVKDLDQKPTGFLTSNEKIDIIIEKASPIMVVVPGSLTAIETLRDEIEALKKRILALEPEEELEEEPEEELEENIEEDLEEEEDF